MSSQHGNFRSEDEDGKYAGRAIAALYALHAYLERVEAGKPKRKRRARRVK